MDSPNRADFLAGLKTGERYEGIVGIYRHNTSADRIGVFDEEIIDALAETGTVKWIAHNGAGYDQIDVFRCAKKGDCVHVLHPLGPGVFHQRYFMNLHLI
jgi:lactate dehydrogenase-like 2-hydroxyacid dehydrogenase